MNSGVAPKQRPKPPNAGKGRPKGSVNKATQEFRQTVQALLDGNRDNVAGWLKDVAEGVDDVRPDPGKALQLLAQLAEFAAPKLARVEVGNKEGESFKVTLDSGDGGIL